MTDRTDGNTDRTPGREPANDAALAADLAAIGEWTGPITAPDPHTLVARAGHTAPNASGRWQRIAVVAAVVALVFVGVAVLTRPDDTQRVGPATTVASTVTTMVPQEGGWRETAPSPLSDRNQSQGVWTGSEVIVFSGNTAAACPMCDYAFYPESLLDGAAYDPATDTWRPIADMPAVGSYIGQALVVDGDVLYLTLSHPDVQSPTQQYVLLRYSVADDVWSSIPVPGTIPQGASISAATHGLLLYPRSHEQGVEPDQYLDLQSGTWTILPEDPLGASYERQYLEVDGSLLLFATSLATVSDSSQPNLVRAARLDDAHQQWQQLPDSDQLIAPQMADGTLAVNPFGGSEDGGEVNNWGRRVANGGILDIATDTWSALPGDVPDDGLGVIGNERAWFGSTTGSVLDLRTNTWVTVPTLPDGLDLQFGQTIVAAGTDLFTFGGAIDARTLHGRSFIWPTGDSTPTTTTTAATTTPATTTTAPPPTVPATMPPGGTVTLLSRGGCGAAEFDAATADETVSLSVSFSFGQSMGTEPIDRTFGLPDGLVRVVFRRGVHLGEGLCNDFRYQMRVDTESTAVAGTVHLVTTPIEGAPSGCGDTDGTLTISGLQMADGTRVADLTIHATLGCFPG